MYTETVFLGNARKSFTLAEVLITIMIIGIIASSTIPSLLKNYKKQVLASQLKAAYSIISQTTLTIAANNGGSVEGLFEGKWGTFLNTYVPYLKVVKYCTDASCIPEYRRWYEIDNGSVTFITHNSAPSNYVAVLNNGMYLFFRAESTSCDSNDYNGFPDCGNIFVDVNGPQSPNIRSYDIFYFRIFRTSAAPFGSNGDPWDGGKCTLTSHLMGCTTKVLKEGAINYDFGHW